MQPKLTLWNRDHWPENDPTVWFIGDAVKRSTGTLPFPLYSEIHVMVTPFDAIALIE